MPLITVELAVFLELDGENGDRELLEESRMAPWGVGDRCARLGPFTQRRQPCARRHRSQQQ